MTKVFLDDALRLVEQKRDKVRQLVAQRRTSAFIKFEDGDDESLKNRPERNVIDITAEIDFINKQIRTLQRLITKANIDTLTDFALEGEKLTLRELLIAIEQFRNELPEVTALSNYKNKKERVRKRDLLSVKGETSVIEVLEVLYDVNIYRKRASDLEKQINAAQREINKHGINVELEFVDSEFNVGA